MAFPQWRDRHLIDSGCSDTESSGDDDWSESEDSDGPDRESPDSGFLDEAAPVSVQLAAEWVGSESQVSTQLRVVEKNEPTIFLEPSVFPEKLRK